MNKLFLLISALTIFFIASCKKDSFISSPDARVNFSSDTVYFDTVFTSTGSITQSFKISNQNDQKLLLSEIRLAGGNASSFKLNIDGASADEVSNIEVAANDSLYVFVTVFIDPRASNLPFIVRDSIKITYNGKERYVQLQAWGQNAHFMKNQIITTNTTWSNDLPYVILGGLQVDSNAILTIESGSRIFFHADAPMLIDGSLQVKGDKYDSTRIWLLSDRLDDPYNGYPGSWPGIYFRGSSHDNQLEYAIIKNAYQGIVAEDPAPNGNPKVILKECIIDNIFNTGILGAHSSIDATNCLVSNCGNNIVLGYGGDYHFVNCTVASFTNLYLSHAEPVLVISNYVTQGAGFLTADLNSSFTNCIFWGDFGAVDDEVLVLKQGDSLFNVGFSNCIWKAKNFPQGVDSSHILLNMDPLFMTVNSQQRIYDFHLQNGSPAIDQGLPVGNLLDLDGNPRPVGLPDLGAYEKQ